MVRCPTTQSMDNETDTNEAINTASEALIEINTRFIQINFPLYHLLYIQRYQFVREQM